MGVGRCGRTTLTGSETKGPTAFGVPLSRIPASPVPQGGGGGQGQEEEEPQKKFEKQEGLRGPYSKKKSKERTHKTECASGRGAEKTPQR
jgi:hypothetical protein